MINPELSLSILSNVTLICSLVRYSCETRLAAINSFQSMRPDLSWSSASKSSLAYSESKSKSARASRSSSLPSFPSLFTSIALKEDTTYSVSSLGIFLAMKRRVYFLASVVAVKYLKFCSSFLVSLLLEGASLSHGCSNASAGVNLTSAFFSRSRETKFLPKSLT